MPRRCIFCRGKPVTKEHIFGLWLSPLFPPPPGKRLYLDEITFVQGKPIVHSRRHPLSLDLQVKQVCKKCNGGWMSKLEEDTMGIISAIYTNTKHSITSEEQALLASWATKTAIMIHYLGKTPITPERRRRWLFKNLTPPPDTCIWMARYDGAGIATLRSKFLFVGDNPKDINRPNGEAVFFSIGSIIFVVLSLYAQLKNVRVRTVFPKSLFGHLLRIWPKEAPMMLWPSQGINDSLIKELYNLDWSEALRFISLFSQ